MDMAPLQGAEACRERGCSTTGTAAPYAPILDADPVATCMVAARVELAGLDPWRLGGEMWAFGSRLDGLCFSGANLVPLHGTKQALRSFADRARRNGRGCSSIVGRAELVLPLWHDLSGHWSRPREVRADQPLMVLAGPPSIAPDPHVRPVRIEELDRYLPAAVAMFTEEVGVDPRLGDGGVGYRARVAELVQAGRAFARFEGDEVVFKAEIGALSRQVGQIQGVWVHPDRRGHGLGTIGTAAVTERASPRWAGCRACTSTGSTPWRAGRTRGSASGRSAASRRCCSDEHRAGRLPPASACVAPDTLRVWRAAMYSSVPVGILAACPAFLYWLARPVLALLVVCWRVAGCGLSAATGRRRPRRRSPRPGRAATTVPRPR